MRHTVIWAIIAGIVADRCELDPVIRRDCGLDAKGNDNIVEKSECEDHGCCWDTTTYERPTPWCFYPQNYDFTEPINFASSDSNNATENDTEPTFIIEEVVIEAKRAIPAKPSVLQAIKTKPSKESTKPVIMSLKTKKEPVDNTPVSHTDLVKSYRKKTCQQLSETKSLNETMKELTMTRMKCDTVDFTNFDADSDPHLNKDTSEGMKVLIEKYKEAAAEKTNKKPETQPKKNPLVGNNPGGIYSVLDERFEDDLGGISETEKMILKNPLMAQMMPEKVKKIRVKTNGCKNLKKKIAPEYQKKSGFSMQQRVALTNTCGSVPTRETMNSLLRQMGLVKVAQAVTKDNWRLPNKKIEYDLIDWNVMEYCLAKIDQLSEDFNCYDKSDSIFDYDTCTKRGCIYYDQKCFYCKQAIDNQKENKIVVNSVHDEDGECAVPSDMKKTCKGFESDSTFDKLLAMNARGGGQMDPAMSILMKRQKKKKCEKLGCCYVAGSKTKDIMMMMMSQQMMTPAGGQPINPAMLSMLGRKRRSAEMMQMLKSSFANPLSALGGGFNPQEKMNNLLMSKMMSDDDEFDCYAPMDQGWTDHDKCMPVRGDGQCGEAPENSDGSDQPWHVVIGDKNGDIHCGATMICSEWAVTTASCLKMLEEAEEDFTVSEHVKFYHDVSTGSELTVQGEIVEIVYHPLFDRDAPSRLRLYHDIAVVNVRLQSPVMPVCLPGKADKNPTHVYTYGFGRFGFGTDEHAGAIKKTKFGITSRYTCENAYGNIDFKETLCGSLLDTSITYKPICEGDRGAAASSYTEGSWTLDAIIAGGPSNCDYSNKPAVFISIHNELQWILEATNNCCTVLSMFR